jgi:hypothetical protein
MAMRLLLLSIFPAALAVTACDQPEQAQPKPQTIKVQSEEQKQLHKLNALNRAIALRRAIYDSGFRCRRVDESGFVQEYKNLSMWTARCNDGKQWSIFVGADGTAQVRDCEEHKQLGLPQCVIRSERQSLG